MTRYVVLKQCLRFITKTNLDLRVQQFMTSLHSLTSANVVYIEFCVFAASSFFLLIVFPKEDVYLLK